MRKLQLLSVVAITLLSFSAHGQDQDCEANATSHYDDDACLVKRLQRLDSELNRVYRLALTAMPEKGEGDVRKGREQLRKAQRAWLTYVDEECGLEGGLQGGSSSWVSTYASLCEEKQFKSRIEFLKSVADKTFGE